MQPCPVSHCAMHMAGVGPVASNVVGNCFLGKFLHFLNYNSRAWSNKSLSIMRTSACSRPLGSLLLFLLYFPSSILASSPPAPTLQDLYQPGNLINVSCLNRTMYVPLPHNITRRADLLPAATLVNTLPTPMGRSNIFHSPPHHSSVVKPAPLCNYPSSPRSPSHAPSQKSRTSFTISSNSTSMLIRLYPVVSQGDQKAESEISHLMGWEMAVGWEALGRVARVSNLSH